MKNLKVLFLFYNLNKENKRLIGFCCLLFAALNLWSQVKFPGSMPGYQTPSPSLYVDVPSPGAASLGKYGDNPISYFTGRPNISIPFYNITIRGVTIPLTLDYDAGGVMVNSLPNWAGQNWTLNAGGVITRTVNGRYDEWIYPEQMQFPKTRNYFQCHDKLIELMADKSDNYKKLKDELIYSNYDLSPDIFTFNFLGKTGKFFLDTDGYWRVQSDDNLEVLFDYNNQSNFISPLFAKYPKITALENTQRKTIAGFRIRDDQGNIYQFGYNRDAIEYTTNFWYMSGYEDNESWHAMSWYLTKITDKYGNTLFTLDYSRGAYIIQIFNSYYSDYVKEEAKGLLGVGANYSVNNHSFPYTFSISSPVYLQKIKGSNGIHVEINSSNVGDSLATENLYKKFYQYEAIENIYYTLACMVPAMPHKADGTIGDNGVNAFYYLQNDNDSLAKFRYTPQKENKYDLLRYSRVRKLNSIVIESYSPADDYSPKYLGYRFYFMNVNRRMRLDSIMIQNDAINYSDKTGIKGFYRFKYNQFDKLPSDYLTTAVDHWGYYNGIPYNINTINMSKFDRTRDPNFSYSQMGSLTEIQYPTGGTSVIEYEPNEYSQSLSNNRQSMISSSGIGGGLRVKSIKEYDSPSHEKLLKRRDFDYNYPETSISSGELFAIPMHYWPDWSLKCEQANATYHLETFHVSSVIPLSNSFGASLGYSYVTEKIMDLTKNGQPIEKTVYNYSNLSDPSTRDQNFFLTFGYANSVTPYDEYSELGFKRGRLLSLTSYDKNNAKVHSMGYKYRYDNYLDNHYTYTSNLLCECTFSAQLAHYLGGIYKIYYPKYDIVEQADTIFDTNKSEQLITTTTYNKIDKDYTSGYPYTHGVNMRLLASETMKRGSFSETNVYSFGSFTDRSNDSILYKRMSDIKPLSIDYLRDGKFVSKTTTVYKTLTLNQQSVLVPSIQTLTNSYGLIDTLVNYSSYTNTGLPYIYKELGKPTTYLKWGLNDNYLLMKSHSYIPISISNDEFLNKETCLNKILQYIKSSSSDATGYVYGAFFNISAIIAPNGHIDRYKYDSFGRLIGIYDTDNKLINSYEYNYRK